MQQKSLAVMPTQNFHPNPDPRWIGEVLAAWEAARESYGRVLQTGADRCDQSLARDPNYRELLFAGQSLYRLGGDVVIQASAEALTACYGTPTRTTLDRLWNGIVPLMRN
jgi:hypothetical protein